MANFLQQIKLDGELYDLHDSEFIIDNRTAAGAALTGVSKAPALFDGMQISYWLDYAAGSSATLNLTLADGTKTGAIPVYYSGTSRLTTHYAAGNVLHMTYRENAIIAGTARGAGWWCDANYYSDSNYDIFGTAMDVDTAVYNYSLFAITGHNGTIAKQTNTNEAGTYWKVNSFTQSSGTGTSKKATTKGFYPYKIFYNPNNTSYTTAGGNTSTVSAGTSNLDLRYTVNGSTSANIGATGAPFFLVGTIESDGLFYLKGDQATKEWWTCGIPTTKNTNYVYWFVGVMSSAYQVRLSDRNWFLKWTGTGEDDHLIQFEPWFTVEHAESADSVPWSGVTGKPTSFTPASHSHGYISNDGSIPAAIATSPASGDKIVITDSSDSDKVKGSITIGSDDGKFLKHDGTWDTAGVPNYIIEATLGDGSNRTLNVTTPVADVISIADQIIAGTATASLKVSVIDDGVTAGHISFPNLTAVGSEGMYQIGGGAPMPDMDVDAVQISSAAINIVDGEIFAAWVGSGIAPNAYLVGLESGPLYGLQKAGTGFSWQVIDTDDHILVMTGTPTGGLDSAPINTTTTWDDYITAITNHDRLVLDIPLAQSRIEFQAQRDDGSTVNVLYAITHSGQRIVTSASYEAERDANGLVIFSKDDSTVSFSEFAGEVNWSGVLGNPYPLNAPSTEGNYSLNVSNGTTTWTTASGGPNTPDAPATDGNYVLNVNSGSSSWEEAPEGSLIVYFTGNFRTETPKATIDAAVASGTPVYMFYSNIKATLLSKMSQSSGSSYTGDYYYFIVPTGVLNVNVLLPQIYLFTFVDMVSYTQAIPLGMMTSDDSNYVISSPGAIPTMSYTQTTASQASLSNGLLSFSSVSASNITSWDRGTNPTYSSAPVVLWRDWPYPSD